MSAAGRPGVLVADEVSRRRDLIGDRDLRRLELAAVAVGAPAPVVERREAGAADRDVGLAEAPRPAEAVGDDDRGPGAGGGLDLGAQPPGGGVGVLGEERDGVGRGDVGGVDPGVGADPSAVGLRDQDAELGADDPPALAQDELHHARVLVVLGGELARPLAGLHRRQLDHPALGLGDDLLGDDEDVAVAPARPQRPATRRARRPPRSRADPRPRAPPSCALRPTPSSRQTRRRGGAR